VIRGSALGALNGEAQWEAKIDELMDAVDAYVPRPDRAVDLPFLMPIEDIFSISGRGTVVTGRIERGKVKVGEACEIVGFRETRQTVCTGVEMFKKQLDEGMRATTRHSVAAAFRRKTWSAGWCGQSRARSRRTRCSRARVRVEQGRRRPSYTVLQGLPSAVLLQDNRCDGSGAVARGRGDGDAG